VLTGIGAGDTQVGKTQFLGPVANLLHQCLQILLLVTVFCAGC